MVASLSQSSQPQTLAQAPIPQADLERKRQMRDNLALQADVCYNKPIKIVVAQQVLTHLLSRFTIRRVGSYRMDSISSDAPQKQCPKCKQFFPPTIEFFGKRSDRKAGLTPRCRVCLGEANKAHYQAHIEELRTYARKKQQEHREERVQYNKEYRIKYPEKRLIYRQIHHEERTAYNRWYRQTPQGKDSGTANNHRRRARLKGASGSFTAQELAEQVKRQKNKCYWCKKKLTEIHADHVVPISRGGTNDISNVVAACPTCNLHRHNKLPHEWPEGGRLL